MERELRSRTPRPGRALLAMALAAPGLVALAWDPACWLWSTWRDPAYASDGAWIALATAALVAISCASGPAAPDGRARRLAWGLLGLTAAIRLAGRLLAVHTVGALALVVDVAAVALWLGVARRPFALHPLPLALFFALSLPFEHYGQRLLGHPLQLLAASASEVVLAPFAPGLRREGVLLLHPAMELAVDLPCSGARGLALFAAIAAGLWCLHRLSPLRGVAMAAAVIGGALLANTARIVALFIGSLGELPVTRDPWHTLLGVAALTVGAVPLLAIFAGAPRRRPPQPLPGDPSAADRRGQAPALLRWPAALGLTLLGVAVAHAPQRPLDVAPADRSVALPTSLDVWTGTPIPLAPKEARFFARWGGGAGKRRYDDGSGVAHTALLVRTRAPLRHLHGPDLCLIGSGHRVERLGVVPGALPTVLYRSVAPDGSMWRVEASFASDAGERASSVSEVVWRWIARPGTTWNLVERISPWEACERAPERCDRFDRALFTSLDLPSEAPIARSEPSERSRT